MTTNRVFPIVILLAVLFLLAGFLVLPAWYMGLTFLAAGYAGLVVAHHERSKR